MTGLDEALEDWLKKVASIGDLTPAEQAKITTAGAKVFKEELAEVTRQKHYSNKKHLKYGQWLTVYLSNPLMWTAERTVCQLWGG